MSDRTSKPKSIRELLESASNALQYAGPVTRNLVAGWIDETLSTTAETQTTSKQQLIAALGEAYALLAYAAPDSELVDDEPKWMAECDAWLDKYPPSKLTADETQPTDSNLVSGLSKLGNPQGESWVTLREAEAAAICAELSKLHAEHLQDVAQIERAADTIERLNAVETSGSTDRRMAVALWRSLDRLHVAVKDCARIGFQESSPTTNATHTEIWNTLNAAQADAALKLKTFSQSLPLEPIPPRQITKS